MAATTFDTLYYAKKLREAGFTEQQAEAQAEALRAVVDENLATKYDIELVRRDVKELEVALRNDLKGSEVALRSDLKEMEVALRNDLKGSEVALRSNIKELEVALRHEIELVRQEIELVRREIKQAEGRITIRLGALIVAGVVVLAALSKLL